jgi:hypothetical protein
VSESQNLSSKHEQVDKCNVQREADGRRGSIYSRQSQRAGKSDPRITACSTRFPIACQPRPFKQLALALYIFFHPHLYITIPQPMPRTRGRASAAQEKVVVEEPVVEEAPVEEEQEEEEEHQSIEGAPRPLDFNPLPSPNYCAA